MSLWGQNELAVGENLPLCEQDVTPGGPDMKTKTPEEKGMSLSYPPLRLSEQGQHVLLPPRIAITLH